MTFKVLRVRDVTPASVCSIRSCPSLSLHQTRAHTPRVTTHLEVWFPLFTWVVLSYLVPLFLSLLRASIVVQPFALSTKPNQTKPNHTNRFQLRRLEAEAEKKRKAAEKEARGKIPPSEYFRGLKVKFPACPCRILRVTVLGRNVCYGGRGPPSFFFWKDGTIDRRRHPIRDRRTLLRYCSVTLS